MDDNKEEIKFDLIIWLQKHWFLIAALFTCGIAWGQAQIKIQSLEEAVKSNSEVRKELNDAKSQINKMDERSVRMLESQQRQERLIEMMLQEQRRALPSPKPKVNKPDE